MKTTALAYLIKVGASPAYNAWREAHPNFTNAGANAYVEAHMPDYLAAHPDTKKHIADAYLRNEYWHPAGWEQWKPGQPQMVAPGQAQPQNTAVAQAATPVAPQAPAAQAQAPAAPAAQENPVVPAAEGTIASAAT
jgi:hypothetical protein